MNPAWALPLLIVMQTRSAGVSPKPVAWAAQSPRPAACQGTPGLWDLTRQTLLGRRCRELSRAQALLGRAPDKARDRAAALLVQSPDFAEARVLHGRASLRSGDPATALTELLPLLADEAKRLLVANGLPGTDACHVVVCRIFDPGPLDRALLTLRLNQFARRRLALLRMEEDGSGCMIAIPVSDAGARSEDAVLRELSQIFDRQAQRAPGFRYGLGQAGPAALSEAATLRREAEEAMAFGVRLNGFNRLNRHDDLLLMRLLAHPAVIDESRASLVRLLHPVIAMGEQGMLLIETLRVWFQEDESMPRTAERLGLHVNTVRQRLERCRAALKLNDMGTNTRLRLYVALQLLPMLRPGEG